MLTNKALFQWKIQWHQRNNSNAFRTIWRMVYFYNLHEVTGFFCCLKINGASRMEEEENEKKFLEFSFRDPKIENDLNTGF